MARPLEAVRTLTSDVRAGASLVTGMRRILRNPLSLEEAAAIVRDRLEHREARFLDHLRSGVYGHPDHPIRRLLAHAGCELGDLAQLVRAEGVEGCLSALLERGVYLTVDEVKGRRPVIRGSLSFTTEMGQLRNTAARQHLPAQSSGSRSHPTVIFSDLAFERAKAVNNRLVLEAFGGRAVHLAIWVVPGGTALNRMVQFSLCGVPPVRWFSLVDPSAVGLQARYRWSGHALRLSSVLAGRRLPGPEFVPLDEALTVARWMADALKHGQRVLLYAFSSPAARLCQEALKHGIDFTGARFYVGGEPLSPARRDAIRQVGAEATPHYGTTESGGIGLGCLQAEAADDTHVFHDRLALIQPGPDRLAGGLRPKGLLLTSIEAAAPLTLVNYSSGDEAELITRCCGCPLERYGWTTHLHAIRSFEKLTAGGMTFFDTDVVRVLEHVLPTRFGGGLTDYQLLEEEDDDGQPRLRLLVHPRVGPLDQQTVAAAFLAAIGDGSGAERVMMLDWQQAGRLQVERRPPLATATGKILHLHQQRGPRREHAAARQSSASPHRPSE